MTNDEFNQLQPGDIVRHFSNGDGYIVHTNNGRSVEAVRIMHLTNPSEWHLIQKAQPKPVKKTAIFYSEHEDETRL